MVQWAASRDSSLSIHQELIEIIANKKFINNY